MPADFNLGGNIPPKETKWSGYCFDETSIVKILVHNSRLRYQAVHRVKEEFQRPFRGFFRLA